LKNKKNKKRKKMSAGKSFSSKKEKISSESEVDTEASNEKSEGEEEEEKDKTRSSLAETHKPLETTVRSTNREKKPNKRYLDDDVEQVKEKRHCPNSHDLMSKPQDSVKNTETVEEKKTSQNVENSPDNNCNESVDVLKASKPNSVESPSKSKSLSINSPVKKSRLKNLLKESSTSSDETSEIKSRIIDKTEKSFSKLKKTKKNDEELQRKIRKKAEKIKST